MKKAISSGSSLESVTPGHMVQLDSLRTIAVLAVIISHYSGRFLHFLDYGHAGVLLFFVLSGFLITGILIRSRERDESTQALKSNSLKRFYVRRTLRIFPLYYAIVIFCVITSPVVRATWLWHLTYSVNFYMAIVGKWLRMTTPFWSLAVEEQFYLLWPIVILFVPSRLLPRLLFALILAGPFSRLVCVVIGANPLAIAYLPTSCLDALGLGALLAFSKNCGSDRRYMKFSFKWGGIVGFVSLCLLLFYPRDSALSEPFTEVFSPFCLSLIFSWLVSKCAVGFKGAIGSVLGWKPSVYVGKISYGIYALHLFAPKIATKLCAVLGMTPGPAVLGVCSLFATVAMASVSWFCFERPINDLKDRVCAWVCGEVAATKVVEGRAISSAS